MKLFTIERLQSKDVRIETFINSKEKEYEQWDDYSDGMLDWEFIQQHVLPESIILASIKENKIEILCLITNAPTEFDFLPKNYSYSSILSSLEAIEEENEQVKAILSTIKNQFPTIVLNWNNHYFDVEESGFEKVSIPYKTENREGHYYFSDFEPYAFQNGDEIRKSFYDHVAKGVIKEQTVTLFSISELREEIYDENGTPTIPMFDHCGHLLFDGFSYFTPKDLTTYVAAKDTRFIVATVLEEHQGKERIRIVGVIKIAKYESDYGEYTGINYVDVHQAYRRLGIAKRLYEKLNEMLSKDDIVIASSLSEIGKKAKINDVRNRIITTCPVFDSEEAYYAFKRRN